MCLGNSIHSVLPNIQILPHILISDTSVAKVGTDDESTILGNSGIKAVFLRLPCVSQD